MGVVEFVDMDHRINEPPTVIEPIEQTPMPFDLANWLSAHFPDAVVSATRRAKPDCLPVIEW
jgi:hypothetical protein